MYSRHSWCLIQRSSGGDGLFVYLLRQPPQTLMLPVIVHKTKGLDEEGIHGSCGGSHEYCIGLGEQLIVLAFEIIGYVNAGGE